MMMLIKKKEMIQKTIVERKLPCEGIKGLHNPDFQSSRPITLLKVAYKLFARALLYVCLQLLLMEVIDED
jgi:hypothetical protein